MPDAIMPTSQPTRSVSIGRYVLAVGSPAGMLISPGAVDPANSAFVNPAELARALEQESDERSSGGERVQRAVVSASEFTQRVEQAESLLHDALDGSLDLNDLSTHVGPILDVLQRLDREGRWDETLRLARTINDVLALAMRWADLVRSLRSALRAAERLPDALAALAWAQHELGTLHLAVENVTTAEWRLSRAREIRQELADGAGLAATEQSLGLLCRQQVRAGQLERRNGPGRRLLLALTAVLLLLAGGVAGAVVDPFDPAGAARLTVRVQGSGTVTSSPTGIRCPRRCGADFAASRTVSLTASAQPGATFAGWSNDCEGKGACRLRLDQARTATARFTRTQQTATVTVRKAGDGAGRIISRLSGIDCGSACRTSVKRGTPIRLVATAVAGDTFTGWSGGGCEGTRPCRLTVRRDATITARFTAGPIPPGEHVLTVIRDGEGSGRVISRPAGISCGPDCTESLRDGATVVLSPAANEGSDFAGWSVADCPDTGRCRVTLDESLTVTATFQTERPPRFTLTTGTTSGSGSISPNCSTGCAYAAGASVTLTASPSPPDNSVGEWTGCTAADGATTCVVAMTQDQVVSVGFAFNEPNEP